MHYCPPDATVHDVWVDGGLAVCFHETLTSCKRKKEGKTRLRIFAMITYFLKVSSPVSSWSADRSSSATSTSMPRGGPRVNELCDTHSCRVSVSECHMSGCLCTYARVTNPLFFFCPGNFVPKMSRFLFYVFFLVQVSHDKRRRHSCCSERCRHVYTYHLFLNFFSRFVWEYSRDAFFFIFQVTFRRAGCTTCNCGSTFSWPSWPRSTCC